MRDRPKPRYVEKLPPDKTQSTQATTSYKDSQQGHSHVTHGKRKYVPKNTVEETYDLPMSTHTSSSSMAEDSCLICSDPIRCKDYIWTCNCCCISMHLSCIKLWINNRNQEIPKEDDKQGKMIYNWSCPQCNYKYVEAMPRYYCYCGKYSNPDFERDLPAHSCGKICNRKRGIYCQHPCPQICHKGKCKPCQHQGLTITCHCGKTTRTARCSQARLIFQCGKKCQKPLTCTKHRCERNCHNDQCQPCKKKHMVKCYCGKNQDVMDCMVEVYECEEICGKKLTCGYHMCEKKCHKGECLLCGRISQQQKTCPCGQYTIEMLTGDAQFRKFCYDSIPVCGMPCTKKLQCGHKCPRSCHQQACPECKIIVDQSCSCGLTVRKIECRAKNKEIFKCDNVCKKKRSCRIHVCNVECCKFRTSLFIENHMCELLCNKVVNCGKHQCGEPCHMGLCKKCPVIYSQPQACPCGKTSLRPPIVCGTVVPECENQCGKMMPCGHQCLQKCHYGQCQCYQQVKIRCRCGQQQITTRCGRMALCLIKCQKQLICDHKCDLQCHKDSCEQAHRLTPCRKQCSKMRKDCKHFCNQICHPGKQCQNFACEAEIIIKCGCGHRQTTMLCGSTLSQSIGKEIVCNAKCQNQKRFGILYGNKQVYYPNQMMQFGLKNYNYVLGLESKLEKFILHSEQPFLELEFRFTDVTSRIALHNLFENNYHLNVHFYNLRNYASFTLMQTEGTIIPKPCLTEYIKLVTKGIIKRTNLPFEFTIAFECQQRERSELIIRRMKDYLHKYYLQRNSKMIMLNFWSRQDGESACEQLETEFPSIEFKVSENLVKEEDEVRMEEIVEKVDAGKDVIEKIVEEKKEHSCQNVVAEESQSVMKIGGNDNRVTGIFIPQLSTVAPVLQSVPLTKAQPLLIHRGKVPTFRRNDYSDSKQHIQTIYRIDQDQLYNQQINWPILMQQLCQIKMGPQATQWRIRALLMISAFTQLPEQLISGQFTQLLIMYTKDKEHAEKILQIQRLDSKVVKGEMAMNGIYLSDHEPQMLSYLHLYNYLAVDKILVEYSELIIETMQFTHSGEFLEAVENCSLEGFYTGWKHADYVLACAMVPFVAVIRENCLEMMAKGGKIDGEDVWRMMLFDSEQHFIRYCMKNGLIVEKKQGKGNKMQYMGTMNEENKGIEHIKDMDFLRSYLLEKRDRKYFLGEPQQLYLERYMTRSFFAFGDHKQSINPKYMMALVKKLKILD